MYLKSIELQGFKSFPDKTKLVFDSNVEMTGAGVTVIVGPNGSGKSNIADAMRWVLGEISAKTLRSTKMEDVIFGGADSRNPMGFAEVSVTFDNSGEIGRLDCPYDEVTVTRRYFRAGESEYFLNRQQVRMRDIYELFMNTGIGRDGYSIIGQGRIAELVSRKSDERRGVFEDASGIAKYRHKKNEAERKLGQTLDNMARVNDIFVEVESQVGPLEREAEKAKKAIELTAQKKTVDVSLWLYDTEKLRDDIATAEVSLKRAEFELQTVNESIDALDARNQKISETAQSGRLASSELFNSIKEQTNANYKLESEFRVSESDRRHTEELVENARISRAGLERSLAEENEKAENQRVKADSLRQAAALCADDAAQNDVEIEKAQKEIERAQDELDTAFADIKEAEQLDVDIKVRISSLESSKLTRVDSNEGILSDIEEYEETQRTLIRDRDIKQRAVDKYSETLSGLDTSIRECADKLVTLNENYGELYSRLNGNTVTKEATDHKIHNLKVMEEQFEGYANSVRFVMNKYAEGKITDAHGQSCGRIYGPLSKVISVESRYVTAVETALGANLQNIVVEDEATAKAAMYALKRAEAGRATFFPLSSMRPQSATPEMKEASGYVGYIGVADELCTREAKFDNVISSLLGRTLVFDNIDNATSMAKGLRYRVRVVTLDGQQINAGGSFTGGSVKQGGGVLSRAEEIKRLIEQSETLAHEMKRLEGELSSIREEIDEVNDRKSDLESNSALINVLCNTEKSALEQILAKMEANQALVDKMQEDYDRVLKMSEQYEDDLAALRIEEQEILTRIEEYTAARSKIADRKADLEFSLDEHISRGTELTIRQSEISKDIEQAQALLAVSEERIKTCCEEIAALDERLADYAEKIKQIDARQTENRREFEAGTTNLEELNRKRNEVESGNLEFERRLNEINALIREKMATREVIVREKTLVETKLENLRERYNKLASSLWDDYELTRNDAVALGYPPVTPENRDDFVRLQTEYRNKLRHIGSVDLGAVEKYNDVKARYDKMSAQILDLRQAEGELREAISRLEGEMKVAFAESFDKINENFGKTFSELFGGGSAELYLTDPENVLESGIEIKAAPPGKIIKNLMQLSGGEQAFIGVALFFAILKVNPTPFCILDEIEAALDEVNVERLAQYIKKYSDGTQFIMITHRRGTMAAATRLYGVTMPTHGISKVLMLDIADIEKEKEGEWNGIFE